MNRRLLQRAASLSGPELPSLVLATVCLFTSAAIGLAFPQGIRWAIDTLGEGKDVLTRSTLAAAVGLLVVQALASTGRTWLFTLAGERIVLRLRTQLFAALTSRGIGFFDGHRTGELLSRLNADTMSMQAALTVNISHGLRNILTVLGGVALLLWMSPVLALGMGVLLPVVGIGTAVYGRRLRKDSRALQDANAVASGRAEEAISAIRTIRAFARELWAQERYRDGLDRSYDVAAQRAKATGVFVGVTSLVRLGAIALIVILGVNEVSAGRMTVGAFGAFLLYASLVAFSLGTLAGLWGDFMKATGASERVFELLDQEVPPSTGLRPDVVRGAIALQDVHFAYPERSEIQALRNVSLFIDPGESLALVGASGSGKSTVASLVSRLYEPQLGGLFLDGTPYGDLDATWLREQVGVVAQEPVLFATSILENIRFGRLDASDEEVQSAAVLANAHGFVSDLPEGYDTEVGERGVRLSGGQKQRIAIARALLKDPSVLVLDEATSALDAESEYLVQQAIERLMVGRTTLIIAHRLSTVRGADRIAVLGEGRVLELGSHDELMGSRGAYAALVRRQHAA